MSSTPVQHPLAPRHPATIVQGSAAHPQRSAWVGASAGTGKTKILIDRVLRLMLPRVDAQGVMAPATAPARILCLTFTKTAAAEMSNRIYAVLARWSVMDDAALACTLEDLTAAPPLPAVMDAARRLFAQVLDAPGGLKIMTIHSFCQSVLKKFPIEAGLAPHFAMLDEMTSRDILTNCLHDLIADARMGDNAVLAGAFRQLSLRLNADDMGDTLQKMMASRARLIKMLMRHGDNGHSAQRTVDAVYGLLDVPRDQTLAGLEADICALHPHDEAALRTVLRVVRDKGTDTENTRAHGLEGFLERPPASRAGVIDGYCDYFLTGSGGIRKDIITNAVKKTMPDADDIVRREAGRLAAIRARMSALRLAEGTAALLTVAADMLGRYADAKKERDALDFDDLILRTGALLSGAGNAGWVLYKLDEGIDHILVDEAQDTSPAQWDVVAALAEDFFSGQGARDDVVRTVFVVGDEKQSIFSFQGADPAAFHRMKAHFTHRTAPLQDGFAIDLEYSFRSTASVLSLVDSVFNRIEAKSGVVFDVVRDVVHLPFRAGDAGHVELWPLIAPTTPAPRTGWAPPTLVTVTDNAQARLATQIADTIGGWLERKEILTAKGRAIRAGDVLILVQSRGEMVERLMRALKSLNIPVAGADRMKLRQEIAIMDLLAAARFGLQPRDDLTLAALLKSPLVGIDEETLFTLCHGRSGTVWSHLHDVRPDLVAWLQPLVATAGRATPYEFFAALLAMPCPGDAVSGRRAFYGRLGRDVADALDEFLNACLSFEQNNVPAVESFADWFTRNESDIKREQDAAGIDQVRIMTVHASKGLQAPIVFLPDTTKVMHAHNRGRIRLLWPEDTDPDGVALWAASGGDSAPEYDARYTLAEERQFEEYRRLLYVALTRAEDRLYICGYLGKRPTLNTKCWYSLIEPAFADVTPDAQGMRTRSNPQQKAVAVAAGDKAEVRPRAHLPAWARQSAPVEDALAKPLAPSRPGEDEPAVKSPLAGADTQRFTRGIILHRLLELLPGLPRGVWPHAMAGYLARPAFALDDTQQRDFTAEIMAVLDHPDFADIFGRDARAEVALTGIAGNSVLSGQVDRLLVRGDEVLVVDYKTNRPPPVDAADVPVIYRKQMAAYVALLRRIYPGKTVKCALLWTDAPRLMPLPDALLAPYLPL